MRRIDSGDLGGGLKGYLSYGYLTTDKWKGDGVQRQHQANGKIVKDLGSFGSLSAFLNFSDRREQDYQDLSYDIIRRRGLRNDNIADNYPLALQIAQDLPEPGALATYTKANNGSSVGFVAPWAGIGTTFPTGFGTVDDAYFDAGGVRRDYLGGVTLDANLTPELTLTTTGYYHDNKGQGSWITPYSPTPAGALNQDGSAITAPSPLGFRTTEYSIKRGGALSNIAYETGANTFEIGGWLETNTFTQARRFYGMTDSATPNRDVLEFQKNSVRDAVGRQIRHRHDAVSCRGHAEARRRSPDRQRRLEGRLCRQQRDDAARYDLAARGRPYLAPRTGSSRRPASCSS